MRKLVWSTMSSEENLSILLVDDDANYADVARQFLQEIPGKRFSVSRVENGERAIEALLAGSPSYDLLLIDNHLPDTDGVSLVGRILQGGRDIPIILLTSQKDFRVAVEAIKTGVEDYLVKEDITDSVLPRTIVNVLERVQLRRQIESAERTRLMAQKKTEAIQELVVTMCHEFNNPLAAIKIGADILLRQQSDNVHREVLKQLNENISRLEHQIVKLRDLVSSRPPA
jgi:DNA-binding NtrC family response regulator